MLILDSFEKSPIFNTVSPHIYVCVLSETQSLYFIKR